MSLKGNCGFLKDLSEQKEMKIFASGTGGILRLKWTSAEVG